MPYAFLCDFDGTASPSDIGEAFVRHFSPGRETERRAVLERWLSGTLGHRALTEAECELVRATEPEAREFVAGFELDPHFAPFARAALKEGHAVMVVSEGFDFYIDALLERAGLGDLPRAGNRVRFDRGRVLPEFPFLSSACEACGNCKAQHVERYRSAGYATVLVGDGFSDRCGARAADRVVARADLLNWCRREGIEALPFGDFADVAAAARRMTNGHPRAKG